LGSGSGKVGGSAQRSTRIIKRNLCYMYLSGMRRNTKKFIKD
jgi:hypothetical protein